MKKILSILAITAAFAACNNNPKAGSDTANTAVPTDTAALNHNAFTDKAREVQLNGVSDTIVSNTGETYVKVKPNEAVPAVVQPVAESNEKPAVRRTTARTRRTSTGRSGTGASQSENSTVSTGTAGTGETDTNSTSGTTTTKKKGWSKAAKGAVIGAGTGAAAGAIISKKKGKGAIIGGVVGAAGGYIIGRGKDKKDGRY